MIDCRKELTITSEFVLKIIFLYFFSTTTNFVYAIVKIDTISFTSDDTVMVSNILSQQDTTPFQDTFYNSFEQRSNYRVDSNGIDKNRVVTSKHQKIKRDKKIDTTHYSPKKAAVWGAAFPGLGQVYNKKYWKLPIVYGILGTAIYFVASNGQKLRTFNGYIRNSYNGITNPAPYNQLDQSEIETFRNGYRKNLQIASFGTIFAWGLSIVDAVVDAHLHHFDISDKLTVKAAPELNYTNFTYYAGIEVHLNFK